MQEQIAEMRRQLEAANAAKAAAPVVVPATLFASVTVGFISGECPKRS